MQAFLAADCVVATGSDETIASLAARVPPPRRFVGYGHRVSVAALGPEALSGAALARGRARPRPRRLALGPARLSLSGVGLRRRRAPLRWPRRSRRSCAELAVRLPRGRVPREAAVAFAHARGEAEMRAAAGRSVTVYGDASWTVVCRGGCAASASAAAPLPARASRERTTNALLEALLPLAPHLAGVALAGFGNATAGGRCCARRPSARLGSARPGASRRRPSPGGTTVSPCCCRWRASRTSSSID